MSRLVTALCATALLLGACGGGSDDPPPPSDDPDVATGDPAGAAADDGALDAEGSPGGDPAPSDPDGSAEDPATDDDGPAAARALRDDNAEAILREVVAVIEAEPLDEAHAAVLADAAAWSEAALEGASAAAALGIAPTGRTEGELSRWSCDAGGSIDFRLVAGAPVFEYVADGCAIDGQRVDGRFFHFGAGRDGRRSEMESLTIERADGTAVALDGERATRFDRVGVARERAWTGARLALEGGEGAVRVGAYEMRAETLDGVLPGAPVAVALPDGSTGRYLPWARGASVVGRFEVEAPWTGGETLSVRVDLALDDAYAVWQTSGFPVPEGVAEPYATVDADGEPLEIWFPERPPAPGSSWWESGRIVVEAGDGSALVVEALAGDRDRFALSVDGGEALVREWSEAGFGVGCFASAERFPGCGE